MRGQIGCPIVSVTRIPHGREIASVAVKKLSKEALFRLKVFDFYFHNSPRFSRDGKPNASITCRRFGIHRSYFYRWKKRYNRYKLESLENRKTTPKKRRVPSYSWTTIKAVREIREANPSWSAKKIRPILLRNQALGENERVPSVATIGRLIRRENLFFRSDIARRKKNSRRTKALAARKRKPYDLKAITPRQIVEFDMKHIYLMGRKQYAFCAIDPFTKEAVVHVATTPSSINAKTALEKTVNRFGKDICVVNDNGSENMASAQSYLLEQNIEQFWTRPQSPKDKPFVERFIGTLQKECLDYHYVQMNLDELSGIIDDWIDNYHFERPHESLAFMTPAEYCDTLGLSIPHVGEVSYM